MTKIPNVTKQPQAPKFSKVHFDILNLKIQNGQILLSSAEAGLSFIFTFTPTTQPGKVVCGLTKPS